MEGESAQGDAGFENGTRGFADAGVSVARNSRHGNSRRGVRVARMANAGIANAGVAFAGTADARISVASPRCHNARLGACV